MVKVPPSADSWAAARASLRTADPVMASLIDADPTLDPDTVLDGWPTGLWDALVFNVVGQQLSVAATRAILARLRAVHDGRLPTAAELLATDTEALRRIGLSRAKILYLRDLAERLSDGRLDLERLRNLDDDAARTKLMQVKGVGRFTADGVLMLALRRPDIWPAADLALRRAVERVWELDAPASLADIDAIGDRFRPWRTLAALYLSIRSQRGVEYPAANRGGNDRVRWAQLTAESSDRVPGAPSWRAYVGSVATGAYRVTSVHDRRTRCLPPAAPDGGGALSCGRSDVLRSFAYRARAAGLARRARALAWGSLGAARYRKGVTRWKTRRGIRSRFAT
jgi:DNA-3-methyladenine glycosylase II